MHLQNRQAEFSFHADYITTVILPFVTFFFLQVTLRVFPPVVSILALG